MLYLFNTTIVPNEGTFTNRKVTTDRAREILKATYRQPSAEYMADWAGAQGASWADPGGYDYISAIGHQGSADAFNAVFKDLSLDVRVNRIQATLKPGDQALCLKIIGRLQEGQILTLEELERVGFEFYLITNIGNNINED